MQSPSFDPLLILFLCLLGLASHKAQTNNAIKRVLQATMISAGLAEVIVLIVYGKQSQYSLLILPLLSVLLLFVPVRRSLSFVFVALDSVFSVLDAIVIQVQLALFAKKDLLRERLMQKRLSFKKSIFNSDSMPHQMAIFIYLSTIFFLLFRMQENAFEQPNMLLPRYPIDHVLYFNGFELILLALCGIGFYVSKSFKVALYRLSLFKPTIFQICVAAILIYLGFAYDAYWAIRVTHHLEGQDLATQLAHYTTSSFDSRMAFPLSVILVMLSATLLAAGEEILVGGALQPVLGILPIALLYALLYGQFALAPIFMMKLFAWSLLVAFIRRHTNTTTTVISHVGFNVITVILFALSP
jgi:hypothetical protein